MWLLLLFKNFNPKEITEWIEDTFRNCNMPMCGVDSIIGLYAGYPITKRIS